MSTFRRILLNPFVLIIPVACALGVLYYFYTPSLSAGVTSTHNILPNSDFSSRSPDGFPTGWQLSPRVSGVAYTTPPGYSSQSSLRVESTSPSSKRGTTVASPEASVQGGHTYFYKSYYKSSVPFDLILQKTDTSGIATRMIVRRYPASQEWTTASSAATTDPSSQSVRFLYNLPSTGSLHLSDTYLQADPQDITLPKEPSLAQNSIPELQSGQPEPESPAGWNAFHSGTNSAKFESLQQANHTPYLRTELSDYKDGEAKWQHRPIPTSPGDYSQFSVAYRGEGTVELVAEYLLSTGERQFVTLSNLLPTASWLSYQTYITTPPNAASVTVSVVLKSNGAVETKDYSLRKVTQNGARAWQRPLLSYAFDDGWLSAYNNSIARLNRAGQKGTFYINPSSIDTPGFMTTANVAALNTQGHELASHSYEHIDLTRLANTEINHQLQHANDYFRQVFGMQSVNFATPLGNDDAQLQFYARKYYTSMRGTQDGINTKQSFDPYNIQVLYVGKDLSLSRLKETIAQTQAAHGWLILVYHRIDEATADKTSITPDQFNSHIDTIEASDITVMTVNKALQEIKQQ